MQRRTTDKLTTVVFSSRSTNLVLGQIDNNSTDDLFCYSIITDAITLVSHAAGSETTTLESGSYFGGLSSNGSKIVFSSSSTMVVTGQNDSNSAYDVFMYDEATGNLSLVSHVTGDSFTTGNSDSRQPVISLDGSWIAYKSLATNLVAGITDVNSSYDLFLFEVATGTNILISTNANNTSQSCSGDSSEPSLTEDGAYLAFLSKGSDLIAGQVDSNNNDHVYVYDRVQNRIILISHSLADEFTCANSYSRRPIITRLGTHVVFESYATDLVSQVLGPNIYIGDINFGPVIDSVPTANPNPITINP